MCLLSTAPLRRLGLLSYALYLWHWSVLSLSAWTVGIHTWTVPLQLALIFGLAHWSHHAIEQPLRRAPWGGSSLRTLLLGLMAALASVGVLFAMGQPLRARLFTGDARRADPTPWQKRVGIPGSSVRGAHCHNAPEVPDGDFAPYARLCSTARRPADRQRLFVLGDSHALALLPLEAWLHARLPLQITHYSRNGCPMPPSAAAHAEPGCWTFSQLALAAVLADVRPGDGVLVHNYFRSHFGEGVDSRADQIDGRGGRLRSAPAKVAAYERALDSLARALAAKQASLLIVADVPRFPELHVDHNLCVQQWFRPWLPTDCRRPLRTPLAAHHLDHQALRQMFAALQARHPNVHVFDPAIPLCPGGTCASLDQQGRLLYRDRDHLNERGVLRLAAPLEVFLQRWVPGVKPDGAPRAGALH